METMPSLRCEEPTWTPTVDFFLSPPDTTAASESAPLVQAEGSAADSSASLASLCFCLSASTTSLAMGACPNICHRAITAACPSPSLSACPNIGEGHAASARLQPGEAASARLHISSNSWEAFKSFEK